MNNFRGSRPGGGRRDFRERPEMHDAICDKCGAKCQVPFRPSGDKPIFCNDCFDRKGGRDDRPRRDDSRRDFGGSRPAMHQAICDKCGASCEVPFRPSGDKPIFCNDCFDRKGGRDDRPRRGTDSCQESKMLLEQMNAKLDKILAGLTIVPEKKIKEPKPAKEVIKKKKKSKV